MLVGFWRNFAFIYEVFVFLIYVTDLFVFLRSLVVHILVFPTLNDSFDLVDAGICVLDFSLEIFSGKGHFLDEIGVHFLVGFGNCFSNHF